MWDNDEIGFYCVSWALGSHRQPQRQNSVHGAGTGETPVKNLKLKTVLSASTHETLWWAEQSKSHVGKYPDLFDQQTKSNDISIRYPSDLWSCMVGPCQELNNQKKKKNGGCLYIKGAIL